MARDLGPKCRLCRREGLKLFLKGERCLTEKCAVERRSYPPGEHGRGRIKQSRVPAPAAREAEGSPVLRPAREAVPQHVREGDPRARGAGREPAPDARDASRQRRLPARLRRLSRAGAPARSPRPLPRQRPPRQHPELRRAPRRRDRLKPGQRRRAARPRRDRPHGVRCAVAPGRPRRPHGDGAEAGPSATRSTRPSRNRSSSSSTRSNAEAGLAPTERKGPRWLLEPA